MNKFTKIRKWAENNGHKVTIQDRKYGWKGIEVIVNEEFYFEVTERESDTHYGVRSGKVHRPAGLYLGQGRVGELGRPHGFLHRSQVHAIQKMEDAIADYNRKKRVEADNHENQ